MRSFRLETPFQTEQSPYASIQNIVTILYQSNASSSILYKKSIIKRLMLFSCLFTCYCMKYDRKVQIFSFIRVGCSMYKFESWFEMFTRRSRRVLHLRTGWLKCALCSITRAIFMTVKYSRITSGYEKTNRMWMYPNVIDKDCDIGRLLDNQIYPSISQDQKIILNDLESDMRPLCYHYLIRAPRINGYDRAVLLMPTEKLLPNTSCSTLSLRPGSSKRLVELLLTREALDSNASVCKCGTKRKRSVSSYQNLL